MSDDRARMRAYFLGLPARFPGPQNWEFLHECLRADQDAAIGERHVGHAEGRGDVAHCLMHLPPEMPAEEKLGVLHAYLRSCLTNPGGEDER